MYLRCPCRRFTEVGTEEVEKRREVGDGGCVFVFTTVVRDPSTIRIVSSYTTTAAYRRYLPATNFLVLLP